MAETEFDEVSLPRACQMLGKSWVQVYRLLLRGELDARQERGRWRITRASVERVLEARAAGVAV
jgi:hypothetical protein